MGKLAERLADAQRSGVYRVETTDAIEEAAVLNGYALTRIALDGVPEDAVCSACTRALALRVNGSWDGLARSLADPGWSSGSGHVLLFTGFEGLIRSSPGALHPLLSALNTAAGSRRADSRRFFAAFLDPARLLSLAPLYNWHRRSRDAVHY